MLLRWAETNAPLSDARTDDIWFFDAQRGWLINSTGDVRMTADGGNSWKLKFFVEEGIHADYLRCMGWSSPDVGWIGVLTNGEPDYSKVLLYQTTNGGETWNAVTNLPVNVPPGVCGFFAVNERVAYGSGSNDPALNYAGGRKGPGIIKTTTGGKDWQFICMSEQADNLIDIFFENETTGWVVGGKKDLTCPSIKPGFDGYQQYAQLKPVVLKTTDGGVTWVNKAASVPGFNCGEWGWKIQFLPDTQVGYVALEDLTGAAILRTFDGGETWTRLAIVDAEGRPINNNLEGIGFINPQQGWVGGWGEGFEGLQNSYTEDSGASWSRENHVLEKPDSDRRVRINRYRFLSGPPLLGFCSGTRVYKLVTNAREDEDAPRLVAQSRPASVAVRQTHDGPSVALTVPNGAKYLSAKIWNHFAVHVRTLADRASPPAGPTTLLWDGKDNSGRQLPAGMYILRTVVDGERSSIMIELKMQ